MNNNSKSKILITLGPSTLNSKFLKKTKKLKVDLLRLNMSHLSIQKLKKNIEFIKKFSDVPICIDTEGAQIRTKTKKNKFLKKGSILKISNKDNLSLYPDNIQRKLKKNDILDIGFQGLKAKIISKKLDKYICRVLSAGYLENNKGVHLVNRSIKLDFLTKKDLDAINLGKKFKINNYALSFTNNHQDVLKFNKILKKENKIFKIETKKALSDLKKIFKYGKNFLIDRGDLSKDIKIEKIPATQRWILKKSKVTNKKIYIATNFLESMIENNYPTRAEINDIFNAFETGAAGIVLAAETAIGRYPEECINLVKRIHTQYLNFKK